LAVLHGIQRFEGRSSLKTWIFRILTNRARTRGRREARCLPLGETDVVRPPAWSQDPWHHNPEHNVLRLQARRQVSAALECLPERQRAVVTLRDVRGLSSQEAADELQISEGNQRVLLHRGRSHARRHLEHGMISALAS
jgi:RNA polymerase sigma-70 factor (ECF subfamily)